MAGELPLSPSESSSQQLTFTFSAPTIEDPNTGITLWEVSHRGSQGVRQAERLTSHP